MTVCILLKKVELPYTKTSPINQEVKKKASLWHVGGITFSSHIPLKPF